MGLGLYLLEVKCYGSTDKGVLHSDFSVGEGLPQEVVLICRISTSKRQEERAGRESSLQWCEI